jgi:CBS domain-containing protein
MKAKDIMTTHVVSVKPETSVTEIAQKLLDHRISAVPVIDRSGRLVGIVSEGDLLHRVETGTDRRHRSWWLSLVTSGKSDATDYVKSHGRHAADVMTRNVITVDENTSLSEIAEILESRRIKRVPVLKNSSLVGIVSRANLVQGLATMRGAVPEIASSDSRIRESILAEVEQTSWSGLSSTNMTVSAGVVELWGFVASDAEKQAWRVAAENVAGVKEVVDHRTVPPAVIAAY